MQNKVREYLHSKSINLKGKKVLLAVSGGVDSMVLADIAIKEGWQASIAHCNFQLRDQDSEADEAFVRLFGRTNGMSVYVKKPDAKAYAAAHSCSIQVAARDLRYAWFDELCTQHGIDYLLTAHHAGDVAETVLFRLVRGSGISGTQGIPPVSGNIVRPLLPVGREEILDYAEKNNVVWREDESNASSVYARNKIRNEVMPLLESINQSAGAHLVEFASRMEQYEQLISYLMSDMVKAAVRTRYEGRMIVIDNEQLIKLPSPELVLFLVLRPYGFSYHQSRQLLQSDRSGAWFDSGRYRAFRSHRELILLELEALKRNEEYEIAAGQQELTMLFGKMTFSPVEDHRKGSTFNPANADSGTCWVDAARLTYPLKVRRWRHGEAFQPLGMQGTKLISDFLTDEKIAGGRKETVYLLLSGDQVVWVAGCRISEGFKVTPDSGKILKIQFN